MGKEEQEITPEVIKQRLEKFALGILALTKPLLRNLETTDMARQLRRAATGSFSNYGAADVARSHADFTSKVGVAYEEADESQRWLRLLKAADLLRHQGAEDLLREAAELRAILSATHLTAKQNRQQYRRDGR